jgi:hypothetical protein
MEGTLRTQSFGISSTELSFKNKIAEFAISFDIR